MTKNNKEELKKIKDYYDMRFRPQIDDTFGVQLWEWIEHTLTKQREEILEIIENERPHHEYCDAYKDDLAGRHNDEIEVDKFALKLLSTLKK